MIVTEDHIRTPISKKLNMNTRECHHTHTNTRGCVSGPLGDNEIKQKKEQYQVFAQGNKKIVKQEGYDRPRDTWGTLNHAKILKGSACSEMVIIVESRLSCTSSNLERSCLHFHIPLIPLCMI